MTLVGFAGSLLVMVTLPVDSPDEVGLKVRDIVAVAPALMVLGVVRPVSANAAPDKATIEMFRSALPEFEMVTLELPVEPTLIDPNSTDVALSDICGPVEAAAVAARFTVAGELPLLPCTVIVPFTFPELVGAKATVRFADWPVPRDMGRALPERLN